MRGYDPAAWEPFFVALISAAAALTGLLFVAVSINLDKIVKGRLLGIVGAVYSAWVLLVEIIR